MSRAQLGVIHLYTLSLLSRLINNFVKVSLAFLEVGADAFKERRNTGASKKSERRSIQRSALIICRSALTSPLAPVSVDLNSGPFSLNPKHSAATLVRRQIPFSAGRDLLVWCSDEG